MPSRTSRPLRHLVETVILKPYRRQEPSSAVTAVVVVVSHCTV